MKCRAAALLLLAAALPACDPESAGLLNAVFLHSVTPASPNASQLPTFNGRSDSGAFIEIFNNPAGSGAPLSTTTASSAGTFAVTVSVPKPSQRTYYAFATPLRGSRTGPSNGLAYASRDGGFQAPTSVACGNGATFASSADFNVDGDVDLAVANFADDTVTVLLGNGDGTFAASTVAVGNGPSGVATGDFNGDTFPDFATANDGAGVSVLLGDGNGGFGPAASPPGLVGIHNSLVAADLDGDADLDLAVTRASGAVAILLGANDGTFTEAAGSPITVGSNPFSIIAANLDGGAVDLVVVNAGSNTASILLGTGGGAFVAAPGSPLATGPVPLDAAAADVDGDGALDLAVANRNANNVSVLRGAGNGSFTAFAGGPLPAGVSPTQLRIADLDGDGRLDLIVTEFSGDSLGFLAGLGGGAFAARTALATGDGPQGLIVADLNGDELPDVVAVCSNADAISVHLGR